MSTEKKLKITEIQRFCMHDGPGIRTTVFLKGCPLRCAWCHNPETQKAHAELLFYPERCIGCGGCASVCTSGAHILQETHFLDRDNCNGCFLCTENCPTNALERCGKEMTIADVLTIVEKDAEFYGQNGGITLSGGEPFAQKDATIALLKACKEKGISTVVETCGYVDRAVLHGAVPFVDLFLWDLKDTNPQRHERYTGVSNESILQNLYSISEIGARVRLRCILMNGINTDAAHYEKIAAIASALPTVEGVEFIPYHAYGGKKATFLGMQDNAMPHLIPTEEQINHAKHFLQSKEVTVI